MSLPLRSRHQNRFACIKLASLLFAAWSLPATASPPEAAVDDIEVLSRSSTGYPTFLRGNLGALDLDLETGEAAADFLQRLAAQHLGAAGTEELEVRRSWTDDLGYVHTRLEQRIHGLRVVGTQVIVHGDRLTGEVYAVNGRFVPGTNLESKARLSATEALESALEEAEVFGMALDEPELVYVLGDDGLPHLAWRALVEWRSEAGTEIDDLFADAATGALVARHAKVHRAKSWETYEDVFPPPIILRCTNDESCGDGVLQVIHDNTSLAYDYYKEELGRRSYDSADVTIRSVGHYGEDHNGAYWNGTYLQYGDGDGVRWGPLGHAFDVVVHELTHAVTEHESGLLYQRESGALNEAWSDIFGALAESWRDQGISGDTWKLGEDAYTPHIFGDARRYLNNPTADGNSRDFYPERLYPGNCTPSGTNDFCGVHSNSGIANLAFYLMVSGGQHPRGRTTVQVPAVGRDAAEQILYRAQTEYLTPGSDFLAARNATGQAAQDLFSVAFRDRVYTAWCAVGVGACPAAPSNDAAFVTQSVPATLIAGQTASVSVTMTNTGSTTWTLATDYRLGSQNPQDNLTWGTGRVDLAGGDEVLPGQSKTFNFTITAPPTVGFYNFQWRMLREQVEWFGASTANRHIQVIQGAEAYDAELVSQDVPTTLAAGQSMIVRVRMKNTGTNTWTRAAGYKLGSENPRDNLRWSTNRVKLPSGASIGPGGRHTFRFTITAPTTPGTYDFQWRMVQEGVRWFGDFTLNRRIVVTGGSK